EKRKARAAGVPTQGPYSKPRETVIGMVERKGRVVALHIPSRQGYTLTATVRDHVDRACSLYTDDYYGYNALDNDYRRRTINHSLRIYAQGEVHTQTVEGFFALLKNGVRGVYH